MAHMSQYQLLYCHVGCEPDYKTEIEKSHKNLQGYALQYVYFSHVHNLHMNLSNSTVRVIHEGSKLPRDPNHLSRDMEVEERHICVG